MSRPFRTLFALSLVAFSIGLSGCETIYRPIYTDRKNYYKPPGEVNKKGQPQLTAEQVLQQTDAQGGGMPVTAPLMPGDAAMPPAAPPAAPDAMAPATPPATPPPAQ